MVCKKKVNVDLYKCWYYIYRSRYSELLLLITVISKGKIQLIIQIK